MTVSTSTLFCIVCGREFRPRDADTVICPDCGGPPEAPAPSQPQGTALADQPRGTVLMSQPAYQRMCILCGQDFTTPDPQADRCPQCRGEAPQSQPEIRSRPESRQPTPAMPAPAQRTVAMPESGLSPAPSSADVPLTWNAGDVILDLYEVKGELGKGGMGVVYRVHHRQWNIDLAVKTPLPEALQKAGSLENFLREAQAWVDLGLHPHIVTCYYVRRLGEMPRVFAECIEGGSLKDWMEDGRLYAGGEQDALKRILDCAIQFAWGLGYAHEKGLVHQDVKPANALMTPDGMLKVTDFGLVGAKGYTPAYAAPEQELGQAVSPRTDLWGWGVSVLEMFTGGVHWQFGSVAASVLENYLQEAPPEGIPPMPAALAELLRRCFQDDPNQRPASMDEVAERLMHLYEQETGAPYPRPKPQALELRADSLNNKAVSLLDLGLEEEAVRCWQEALQADPAHLEANFNYGYYRWQRAEIPGSRFLEEFLALETRHQSRQEYWDMLGWIYLEQGKVEEMEGIRDKIQDKKLLEIWQNGKHTAIRPFRRLRCENPAHCIAFGPRSDFAWVGIGSKIHEINLESFHDLGDSAILEEDVTAIAISPDGYFALSGNKNGIVRTWALSSYFSYDAPPWLFELWLGESQRQIRAGQSIRVMQGHERLNIWQDDMLLPRAHTGAVNAVKIFPDSNFGISGGDDCLLRCWELKTGNELMYLEGHTQAVTSVDISPDGRYVLSGSWDGTIRLWNISDGKEILCLKGHDKFEFVNTVAFVPKSRKAISGSTDTTIRLWDLKSGTEIGCWRGHTGSVNSVTVSPNGQYVISGSDDGTIRFWEVCTGREICCLEEHLYAVTAVAFSPQRGHFLSTSKDCHYSTLILWHVRYPQKRATKKSERWYISRVILEEIATIQQQYWNLLTTAKSYLSSGDATSAYKLLRQAQSLSGYERDNEILQMLAECGLKGRRKGLKDAWLLKKCVGHNDEVTSVIITQDNSCFISGSRDGTLRIWDILSGQELCCLEDELYEMTTLGVNTVAITPDGKRVLSGSYAGVCIWDLEQKSELAYGEGHTGIITAIAVSADGRYAVSGSDDWGMVLWDLDTGMPIKRWEIPFRLTEDAEANGCYIKSLVIVPEGDQVIAGCQDCRLRCWNLITGSRTEKDFHLSPIEAIALSPDGVTLLSASAKTLAIWKRTKSKQIRYIDDIVIDPFDDFDDIWTVAVSPDGRYAILGGAGKFIPIFDLKKRERVYKLQGQAENVRSVAISTDGRFIVAGNSEATISIWALDWDYDFPAPADWDEGARPYLDIFLTLHTPYGPDGLSRVGKPQWTEEDFQKLLQELGYRGYGWLRPAGVRRELEKMAKERS
jgi:WD40 repeat protein/serine/threonine protein kinase